MHPKVIYLLILKIISDQNFTIKLHLIYVVIKEFVCIPKDERKFKKRKLGERNYFSLFDPDLYYFFK